MEVQNVFGLFQILGQDDEGLYNNMKEMGLLRKEVKCKKRNCRRKCSLQRNSSAPLGYMFRCPTCRAFYSILTGSFFERCKLPIRTIIFLMWEWACLIRVGCASISAGCSRTAGIQQYRFLRDICSWNLMRHDELFLLGMSILNLFFNYLFPYVFLKVV